ncbi:hypothetical protein LTR15_006423 [Elasticomyces elasticus]|nr:hypothetical protein LTR15_006423 [Elasticomyces elasticus]
MSRPPPLPPRPEDTKETYVVALEPRPKLPPRAITPLEDAIACMPPQSSSEDDAPGQPDPRLLYQSLPINPDEQIRILVLLPANSLADELCGQLVVQDVDLRTPRTLPETHRRDMLADFFNLSLAEFFKKNSGTREDYIQDLRKWMPKTYQEQHQHRVVLKHLEGSAQPVFEALSYTWGSWVDSMAIHSQDHGGFPITRNLWSALRRSRSTTVPVRLWIDQISIDQQNIDERNRQVRVMSNIYSLAWDVRIWLGDLPDAPSAPNQAESAKDKRRTNAEQLFRVLNSAEPTWWTRTWCIQEFMMARQDPLVSFGPVELRWTEMVTLGKRIKEDKVGMPSLRGAFRSESTEDEKDPLERVGAPFFSYQRIKHTGKNRSLAAKGWAVSQTQATNPRDKVYSLLGLIDPGERALITIDYSKEVAWVFAEATYASIVGISNLNILHLVKQEKSDIPLPSWVVDFSHPYKDAGESWIRSSDFSQYLYASEPIPWCRIQDRSFAKALLTVKRRSLVVTGLQFDTIVRSIRERSRDQYCDELVRGAKDLLKALLRLVSDQPVMLTMDEQALFEFVLAVSGSVGPYLKLAASEGEQASTPEYSDPPVLESSETEMQMLSFRLFDIWSRRFLRGHVSGLTKVAWRQYGLWKLYFRHLSGGDTFFITRKGFIGLGHKDCQVGDVVALPYGSRYPVLLRPDDDNCRRFGFLGFTYVNGVMNDELRKVVPELVLEERDFVMN